MTTTTSTTSTLTILEVLMSTMGALPTFNIVYFTDDGRLKDRVLKHDLLHILLIDREWPVQFRFEDEYCAAIVQAVLMRDSRVSAQSVSAGTNAPRSIVPSLQEIMAHTIPGVIHFLYLTFTRLGLPVPQDFRPPEISFVKAYYLLGQCFEQTFCATFATDYGSIRADTLKDLPFVQIARSFNHAVDVYDRVYGDRPVARSPYQIPIRFG
ncbi:hypothetical protein HW132_00370 [Brasilonema sp. CT11]|nr:hypothetical protein [Brasilonema sp. CT11]